MMRMMKSFTTMVFSFVFALGFASSAAFAQNVTTLDGLTRFELRPRTVDFLAAIENEQELAKQLIAETSFNDGALISSIRIELAQMIAKSEALFPDLQFVFLGRDMAFIADLVDAYFMAHGQVGRVIRLDVSRESLETTEANRLEYLRDHGFEITAKGLERPYVFFDRSQYMNTYNSSGTRFVSQLKLLLSAAFHSAETMGLSPSNLKTKLGAIKLTNPTATNEPPGTHQRISREFAAKFPTYFETWKMNSELPVAYGKTEALSAPQEVMEISIDKLSDTGEWHGKWSAMHRDQSGRLVTIPLDQYGADRSQLVHQFLVGSAVVQDRLEGVQNAFHETVLDELRKLNSKRAKDFGRKMAAPKIDVKRLLEAAPDGLPNNRDRLNRLVLVEQSNRFTGDLARFQAIGKHVRDPDLYALFKKIEELITRGERSETAPKIASVIARVDLLMSMLEEGRKRDRSAYEATLARVLFDLEALSSWAGNIFIERQEKSLTIAALQQKLFEGRSKHSLDVVRDLYRKSEQMFPTNEKFFADVHKRNRMRTNSKVLKEGSSDFWYSFTNNRFRKIIGATIATGGAALLGIGGTSIALGGADAMLIGGYSGGAGLIIGGVFVKEWVKNVYQARKDLKNSEYERLRTGAQIEVETFMDVAYHNQVRGGLEKAGGATRPGILSRIRQCVLSVRGQK